MRRSLKIAMIMADFTAAEAEELRRALSFHRSQERMKRVEEKLRAAMARKGASPRVIEQILQAISSFALYGFPESHAISFAILAYGSAYLKLHYAPEFYASLLNNQPMGFYSSATIVKDARRHGLKIRPVCTLHSQWECAIGPDDSIRLGFCVVQGLRHEHGLQLLAQRQQRAFASVDDLKARTPLNRDELRTLAEIGALNALATHRRDALWKVESASRGVESADTPGLAFPSDTESPLSPMNAVERLQSDYIGMRLTTGPHPMAILRPRLKGIWRAADLANGEHGQIVRVAGSVICRQRPGTAKGFVFISLEDETGISNAIVTPDLFEKMRLIITQESYLIIEGQLQHVDDVISIKAWKIEALPHGELMASPSYDFR